MGSGKSSVGKTLSQISQYKLIDTDHWIESKARMTIPDIFEKKGESEFRSYEQQCVNEYIQVSKHIFSTGGGLPIPKSMHGQLKQLGHLFFLDTPLKTAIERCQDSKRPLLKKSMKDIQTLFDSRQTIYKTLADHCISTENQSTPEIAQEIWNTYNITYNPN